MGRGSEILHSSGRKIIPTDNSPASWSFFEAYVESRFDISNIEDMIKKDEIPIAMVLYKREKENAIYKNTNISEINKKGWRICHINSIGFGSNPINSSIEEIEEHFRRFLSPSNMFLVPKILKGLGELPQMIEIMRNISLKRG